MDKLGYQDLLSKSLRNGLPEGGNSTSSFQLQGKAESVVGTGRFLENLMSCSLRQDTSGAAEGPLTELNSGHGIGSGMDGSVVEKRGSPSVHTHRSVGSGVMRGRALRTEDSKIDGFHQSLLKSRVMGTKARTDVQSPMLSFRSLLEGAISASGVQPTAPAQRIAESGLQYDGFVTNRTTPEPCGEGKGLSVEGMSELRKGERNFALPAHDSCALRGDTVGASVSRASYSSLLQAQLGGHPFEARADPSCKTVGTLRLSVEAHSPPDKLQLQAAEVEGGFLALLNHTTRLHAPVAQRPSSPRTDSVSNGGRTSGVHFSDKLLQAAAGDASRSADALSERDGSDSLRATAVLASTVLARSEGAVPLAEAVVERRSSKVAHSMCSDEDASGSPLPEKGGGPLAVNESRSADLLSNRLAFDFSNAVTVPASPILTRREDDVSRADVLVGDSASIVDEMSDAQLLEELSRGLAIEQSRFAEDASNMGAVGSPESAAALASAVPTRAQKSVPREVVVERPTVVVADSLSTDEKALEVHLSEEPSGALGVDESRFTHNVPERDVPDSPEAVAVPEVPVFTRLQEADLPAGIERASYVVADTISDEGKVSDIQREDTQALALDESRPAEFVSERDTIDSLGSATVSAPAVLVRREVDVPRAEVVMAGFMSTDEEMSDLFVSDQPSQAPALDGLRNRGIMIGEDPAKLPEAAAELESLLDTRAREDVPLSEALVEKELGLSGDALGYSEQSKDHLLSFNRSDEELSVERIQSPSQRLEKRCADGCDGLIDGGTALVSSCEAGLKQMGDADADSVDAVTILEWSCKAGLKDMEDVDRDVVKQRGDYLCKGVSAGTVDECPRQAVSRRTENPNALFVEKQDGEICDARLTSSTENESFKSEADIESTKIALEMELDISEDGPAHSIHTESVKDGLNVNALVEESSSLLPPSSNEVIDRLEVEQHNFDTLADELTEKQLAVLPYSESQGANQGFIVSRSSCESEELPPSELVVVEPDLRNEEERVQGHVGEIVDSATDSGNVGVPIDQAVSPDAVSEGLRQVILRDSDATASESLESVQVSGAEFGAAHQEAGKEVQSPLVMKSKDRRSRDVGDVENRLISHSDDREEIEEQPYASPLNGTVNDQLVGVEVRSFKRKGRPRVDNHEKTLHGTGRPHLQPSGSKRKRHLQYAGNRWRRNRHIDPDQPVPVYIEGRDEWLAHQDKGNSAPSSSIRKRVRQHGPELIKPLIAIPSFRFVADYEERQQEVETRRKAEMQRYLAPSTHETLMSSRTVRASDYDMDDEDERWLHAWNKRLARGGLKQPISEDKFEEMIEYFERMYAQMEIDPSGDFPGFLDCQKSLAHSVPGSSLPSTSPSDTVTGKPSDDSLQKSFETPAKQHSSDDCCICNGGEDDQTNPVYTCKRCLIHVHQSCYGIREKFRDDEGRVIAPPSWCCRKCEAVAVGAAQPNVSCVLCRKRGGALKPTVAPRKWAHVACALYTNETFFVDPDAMEPIDGIAAVAARSEDRQDRCGLCGVKRGICSFCSVRGCRAPFHISCGVSQGASFELRQSKKKVVGVRSFCPRHARTTPMDSTPSAGLKELVSSSTTSGSTVSPTASGSISTASSLDYREEWSSRQNTACMGGSFIEPARQATNVGSYVADVMDHVVSVTGKGTEDTGRERPTGLRFTLKRRRDEPGTQVSEDGVTSDVQKKSGNGDKIETPGCKSTWHVVDPGEKLKKIKFKFGKLAQSQDPETSPSLVQQERIGSEDPEVEKIKEVVPTVGEVSCDAYVNDGDTAFVNDLSEDRFVKEVKELAILEQAMKSDVAPLHIMREAFVYWRAKRAGHKGFLLCELNHKQWSKFQGIFNKDSSDEGNRATGKLRVPLALQPSPLSTEKMLEKAKELRELLDRVRSMARLVVRREKLKYNQQLVQMTIASAELNRSESTSEERHCVWCPSTKTLLKCGTCPRSFCFNCFKNRKGFGVKGWMAASKQAMYSCKYCRELLSNVADFSNNLDPTPEEVADAGLVSTPVVASERVDRMVSTPGTSSELSRGAREREMGKGRDEGWTLQEFDNPSPASVIPGGGETIASAKGLVVGRGKGIRWAASENAGPGSVRRGSENGANDHSKLGELETGLNKFLSIANDQMEHSSFETTLRRLKILRHSNEDVNQEQTVSAEIPSGDLPEETADVRASGPVLDELEPSRMNGVNASVVGSPASGPALLVYKKNRRLILSESSESPPSAYDFSDKLSSPSPTGLENVTLERTRSPGSGVIAKRLEIGGLERI